MKLLLLRHQNKVAFHYAYPSQYDKADPETSYIKADFYTNYSTSNTSSLSPSNINTARSHHCCSFAIIDVIRRNACVTTKSARIGFHICVDGCDGCVDLLNVNNHGLDVYIAALDNILKTQATNDITSADL